MKRDTMSGLALILGSVGLLVTMALHPSPHNIEALVRQSALTVGTHSLALASIPITFLGFLGLYQRLKADYINAPAALVIYAFGATAVMSAAVLSGLVAPAVAAQSGMAPNSREIVRAILHYNGHLNAAFAMVFMIAMSVAVIFWSIAILRTRAFGAWVGWIGCVVGLGALAGVLSGYLDTTVQGFGLFILGTSAWVILVGIVLCRPAAQAV